MANDTDIGRLEGVLQGLDNTIKKFDKALFGNGQPGAMERITRIEENLEKLVEHTKETSECYTEASKETSAQIKSLAGSVNELKILVNDHIKDNKSHHPFGLLVRKEVVFYSAIFVIALQLIIPPDLSLWDLAKNLLGF